MIDVMKVAGTMLLSLLLASGAVFVGNDRTTLVPPPELVAEQFTRDVATRRYDRAVKYVENASGITLVNVRLGGDRLQAGAGAVENVEGEPGWIRGEQAAASAILTTTRAGRVRYVFRMARRNGLWKIVEWQQAR